MSANKDEFDLGVTKEFIEENNTSFKNRLAKKGGPYSKKDRESRRTEVFRLHFEYGYSAIKIAEMMKINRNTINGDIQYLYSQVSKKWKSYDPQYWVMKYTERLEVQKTRLRERLDKTETFQERLAVEKMIFDVDSKILQIHLRLVDSSLRRHELATKWLNNWMKKNKKDDRYFTYFDTLDVSSRAHEKIKKIIKENPRR